ncbi:hypothetical protein AcidC75_23550 [Acidisoma sp. C75]
MQYFAPSRLSANHLVTRMRKEDYLLTVIIVTRLRIEPEGISRPVEEEAQPGLRTPQFFDDGEGPSPLFGGDYAPFKPRTDVTLMGSAHAPGGGRARQLRVTFGVGDWRKQLDVFGDRVLRRDGDIDLSEPELFSCMPLRLDNAFGGLSSAYNPWGKGFGEFSAESADDFPVCNIHPEGKAQLRWDEDGLPAGFGPLPEDMQPRLRLRGTYDERWLRKRNPLPPLDFDWAFYNCAPADQQFSPYLSGNEVLFFENLHPRWPHLTTRLWGQRLRVLLRRGARDAAQGLEYLEVRAPLDSVHVDTEAMTVDLAWRAVVSTGHPEAREFTDCYIATEAVEAEAAPLGDHVAAFEARLAGMPPVEPPPPPPPPQVGGDQEERDAEAMQMMQDAVEGLELPQSLKESVRNAKTPGEIRMIIQKALEEAEKTIGRG